jgi:ABC-2 type transport system permease protein
MIIYLISSTISAFHLAGLYSLNSNDLAQYFYFQPFILLFIIPAITIKLFSEEFKQGTIELIRTLPIKPHELIIGKILACSSFMTIVILMSTPIWIILNLYIKADNQLILYQYLGLILLSSTIICLCSIGSMISNSIVNSYIYSFIISMFFMGKLFQSIWNWTSHFINQKIALQTSNVFDFMTNYNQIILGNISITNVAYFILIIIFTIWMNIIILEDKK